MSKIPYNSPNNSKIDSAAVELSATTKLQAGNYKEAIELYKTLLKTAQNPEWQQALAHCYLQRALSFAEKGMVKEAIVLWESYNQYHASTPDYFDYYLTWLLHSNDNNKIKKYVQQLTAPQLDEQYPQFASLLGLLILTNKPELQALLSQETAFIRHLTLAQAALAAYKAGQLETVNALLQQLPFRSAFKDFRIVLKAALLFSESSEQAQTQLKKIPTTSPYYNLAKSLLTCAYQGSALVTAVSQLSLKQAQLVGSITQLSKKQLELLEIITKQKERLSDKLKFNVALQYRALFGEELSRRYCYSALASYTAGQRDFIKHFGNWDEFEECRLKALSYERKDDFHDALYYWKRCVALLQKQESADKLKIALLMRHIAAKESPPSQAIAWLEDSLDYDPNDRECYLKIVTFYSTEPQQTDELQLWLQNSIEKFPHDIEFLVIAAHEALRRQAFEQAISHAETILKVDPVNAVAKQILFNSCLAQLRNLIQNKQFQLLDKTLQNLQEVALNRRDQLTVAIMQKFCTFATTKTDKAQNATLIADSVATLYSGLLSQHLYVLVHASLMGLPLATFTKSLPPLEKNDTISPEDLQQFIELSLQLNQDTDTQPLLVKLIDKIKAPIKYNLGKKRYTEALTLSFCQCMEAINHFDLLRTAVKNISYKWESPIWPYYRVYSSVNGDPSKCTMMNVITLRMNLNAALESSDHRTAVVIEKFMDKVKNHNLGKQLDDMMEWDAFDEAEENPLSLFDDLPDEIFEKLDKKANERLRKHGPERLIVALLNQYFPDDDGTIRQTALKHIIVLHALNMLKAAEELGIELDIDPADIIKRLPSDDQPGFSLPPSFNLGDLLR